MFEEGAGEAGLLHQVLQQLAGLTVAIWDLSTAPWETCWIAALHHELGVAECPPYLSSYKMLLAGI